MTAKSVCPVHGTPMRVVEIGSGRLSLNLCDCCEQADDDLLAFLTSTSENRHDR